MTRGISPAMLAALADRKLRPAYFFHGEFATGDLRLWSGIGDITWGGFAWAGAGSLFGVSGNEETTDIVAAGASVQLSGVPAALVQACIAEVRQGMAGRVYFGLRNAADELIGDPALLFEGRIDVPEIADGADTCSITITYESRLIELQRAREWRYTDQSQKALYPGDRGFEFVTPIQDQEITWGRA